LELARGCEKIIKKSDGEEYLISPYGPLSYSYKEFQDEKEPDNDLEKEEYIRKS
jgi:hypothetical protein